MTIDELIAALEKAEGPSRELDIECALNCEWKRYIPLGSGPDGYLVNPDGGQWQIDPPPFTSSLDAALTLVPEGMEWSLTTLYGEATAEVGLNNAIGMHSTGRRKDGNVAIALCIAALKARRNA